MTGESTWSHTDTFRHTHCAPLRHTPLSLGKHGLVGTVEKLWSPGVPLPPNGLCDSGTPSISVIQFPHL